MNKLKVTKLLAVVISTLILGSCASGTVQDQIQASAEGRALERMADNLSNKAEAGHCSIIRTGGFFYASTSVSISCP